MNQIRIFSLMLTFAQLLNTSYKTINIVNGEKKSIENKEHASIIKSIHVIFFISENNVEVRFINSSPRVNGNIVAADFFFSPRLFHLWSLGSIKFLL